MKRSLSIAATTVLAGGLVALGATGAAAHVTVSSTTTDAGASALLTFNVGHGCGTSATTDIAIQVPEEFTSVTPTVNPGWDIDLVMETLDTPLDDGHGGEQTERVGEVLYTADTPLPDGHRDTFELSVQLPDTPGEQIAFPVVQTCEEGESAWVQLADEGQDPHDLELPAPVLTVTSPGGEAATDSETEETEETTADEAADAATTEPADGTEPAVADDDAVTDEDAATGDSATADSGVPTVVPWLALVLGAGGLVLGGLAFARARNS